LKEGGENFIDGGGICQKVSKNGRRRDIRVDKWHLAVQLRRGIEGGAPVGYQKARSRKGRWARRKTLLGLGKGTRPGHEGVSFKKLPCNSLGGGAERGGVKERRKTIAVNRLSSKIRREGGGRPRIEKEKKVTEPEVGWSS